MDISESNLNETLNMVDIEGLLQLGAPSDEYSHEAQSIASALSEIHEDDLTEDKLTEVVRGIWTRAFGPFSDADIEKRSRAFRRVAHEVHARSLSSVDSASLRSRR